jgi:hypothetical protein
MNKALPVALSLSLSLIAGCNALLQSIALPAGSGGDSSKTQASASPSPTAKPAATATPAASSSPSGPTPAPKVVPAFTDAQNRGLRVNSGVTATFAQIPKTTDAAANAVLDGLSAVMGAPSALMGVALEVNGDGAVDTSTRISTKEQLLTKLNTLPIPKDDSDIAAAFLQNPALVDAPFATQALRRTMGIINLGTREAPTTFNSDVFTFLPAGSQLLVFGNITDAARGMTISEMRIKAGSKLVRSGKTVTLDEDTGLGFSTVMTYSSGVSAGMGFYDPFTRAGTIYFIYQIASTATGGTITGSCSFYLGGWKYLNGTYTPFTADSQQAQDFKTMVGGTKSSKIKVTYTKKSSDTGEIEATIYDVKDFDNKTVIDSSGVTTPKATLTGVANQILDAFTNNQ